MALSKYSAFLLDSSPFFADDLLLSKSEDVHKDRYESGEFHKLYKSIRMSNPKFYEYTGVSIKVFDYLLEHLKQEGLKARTHKPSNIRKNAISAEEKLLLTLRYFSSGLSFTDLAVKFRMGRSTAADAVYQTSQALWDSLHQQHMRNPNTYGHVQELTEEYWLKWKFPNCIGAIAERTFQGTRMPSRVGPRYKKFPFFTIQGIADANYKFLTVEVIAKKSVREETFKNSKLNKRLQNGTFAIPASQSLPNSSEVLPIVVLGDEGYPLLRYLMRAYYHGSKPTSQSVTNFNKRIEDARRPIKCAYEMLFSRWKFLSRRISTSRENTKNILSTVCLLHNVVCTIDGNADEHIKNGIERFTEIKANKRRSYNRHKRDAATVRNSFVKYFDPDPDSDFEEDNGTLL